MTGFLIFIGLIAGAIALLMVAIFLASMLETQHAIEFAPMTGENEIAAMPYLTAMAASAAALGYVHGGELRHVKYPLRASTWITPDRKTIAAIYGGRVAGLTAKRTKLFSRLNNGAVIVTTDETGLPDHTGLQTRQLVMNASFDELHAAHVRWVEAAEAEVGVRTFDREAPQELEAMDLEIASQLEAFGLIRFRDRSAGTFRHTLKGAFANSFSGFFKALAESSKQAHRQSKARPG